MVVESLEPDGDGPGAACRAHDDRALHDAVRWVQDKLWVDRLEATIEAHILPTAEVREACGIPGTSRRTAWLCRDKPAMKEALRSAGVPTAASACKPGTTRTRRPSSGRDGR